MEKNLLIISALVLILTACGQTAEPVPIASPEVTAGLPDTWTPAPSAVPSSTPTPAPTFTPTPTSLPSSTPDAALTKTLPAEPTFDSGLEPDGTIWLEALVPGQELQLSQIEMFSPYQGWAIGSGGDPYPRILITEDGGQTWQDRTPPAIFKVSDQFSGESSAAFFQSNLTAWVYFQHEDRKDDPGEHRVWRTTDGGQTWNLSTPLPFPREMRYFTAELIFINSQVGWLRSFSEITHMNDYAHLFQTTNGGQSWALINQPGDGMLERLVNSQLGFANTRQGWMLKDSLGGFEPFLEVTSSGGWTWKKVTLPAPDGGWDNPGNRCVGIDPYFFGGARGAFLLNCAPPGKESSYDPEERSSYLYLTGDFGDTWTAETLPGPVDQLIFLDEDLGFALGREHFRTEDGGASWEQIKTVNWTGDFSWVSPLEAWAVASSGGETALVHTVDGGQSYQTIEPRAGEDR